MEMVGSGLELKVARVYLTVQDMDRSLRFYEDLLGVKASHREGDDLVEFQLNGLCLELLNSKKIEEEKRIGNNCIVVFSVPRREEVDLAYEKILMSGNQESDIYEIDIKTATLRGFQFHDSEGNRLELYHYDWKK